MEQLGRLDALDADVDVLGVLLYLVHERLELGQRHVAFGDVVLRAWVLVGGVSIGNSSSTLSKR